MSLHQKLWDASRAGDHPAVQRALDQGADVQAGYLENQAPRRCTRLAIMVI